MSCDVVNNDYVTDAKAGIIAGPVRSFVIGWQASGGFTDKITCHVSTGRASELAEAEGSCVFCSVDDMAKALGITPFDLDQWICDDELPDDADRIDLPLALARLTGKADESPPVAPVASTSDEAEYRASGARVEVGMIILPPDGEPEAEVIEVCNHGCFVRPLSGEDKGKVFGVKWGSVLVVSEQEIAQRREPDAESATAEAVPS